MRRKRVAEYSDMLDEQGGVNLTPLIDVVFVVLILFILIAPMLEIDKIQLAGAPNREESEKVVVSEENLLVIHVRKDNAILINKRVIKKENLSPILSALYTKNPKLIPQLFQDREALFGTYQIVKNAVEEAGYKQLDVVLDPCK
ncbi:MAG: Biopolymer transport protein ExbD [Chlamydiae bacterium]|nr:Biopolymer transport protein ExbD [Chlamydiota bacterium]